ncbi:MAG: isocitrate dehydrogenase kinase/phosphatase AceK regulatory subunit [Steroidobacteraceae bacterium]
MQRVRRRADPQSLTPRTESDLDTANDLATECARHLAEAFAGYNSDFRAITRRAPQRFESRDWQGSQRDAVERIDLYDRWTQVAIAELKVRLGARAQDRSLWVAIRNAFEIEIAGFSDKEFTKTFFSSISRRLFGTVGVAPEVEFVATELDPLAGSNPVGITRRYENRGALNLLFEDLLGDLRFRTPWRDLEKSAAQSAADVASHLRPPANAGRSRWSKSSPRCSTSSRAPTSSDESAGATGHAPGAGVEEHRERHPGRCHDADRR